MAEHPEEQDRLERDQARSTEAHWAAAEAGAGDAPMQKAPEGSETPVPKRSGVIGALRKLVQPVKKP